MNVKMIKFQGFLDVSGIYNYNGVGRRDGNNNHKNAKQTHSGIDFTSSRCIRHEMFKELQPRQPSSKEFADQFVRLAASEVGLIRGFLSPDDGYKRNSPLHIADAYTVLADGNQKLIIFDQGSSSKPKESSLPKDRSDTSIFSQDNAPPRRQQLVGGIDIKELSFLSLDDIDSGFAMVGKNDEEQFISLLNKYFSNYGIRSDLSVKQYKDKSAVLEVPRRGILLNDQEVKCLIKQTVFRVLSINGIKSGASLKADKSSFHFTFCDGENEKTVNFEDFPKTLEGSFSFHQYFEVIQ